MISYQKYFSACLLGLLTQAAFAQPPPPPNQLGAAANFAVLGGTAVTCTAPGSVVLGDVGVSPGSTITNSTNCTIAGTPHLNDDAAIAARTAFDIAYAALLTKPCTRTISGNLAGQNLRPGVYCVAAASATTGGTLTLDGPSDGIWIFKIGAALTGTGFSVVMAGGAQACNVYWRVTDAATMTDSNFKGTILAGAAITITGGTFAGRALADADGAVTMTGASVIGCGAPAALLDSLSCKGKKHKGNGHDDDDDDDDDGDKKKGKKKGNPFGKKDKDD